MMFPRWRLAGWLRLLSAASLLALAVAFFAEPFGYVLGPELVAGDSWLGRLPQLVPGADRPARGFMVTARPRPPGALLQIDGLGRGRTPAVANVTCRQGDEVQLRLTAPGFTPWERTVPCREGGSLLVRPRLQPAR